MQKQTIFSGIQPSGDLHIGNYIGAISQWVGLQNFIAPSSNATNNIENSNELIFCIVDLHAITVKQDPKLLKEKILEVAALYMACGIDPKTAHIFIQSENHDHSYLAWLFDCITPIGWLNRMIQFKDKSEKQKESTTVGLFNYPPLMAADILLYDTDLVPVGNDQKQHIELTCDIADRFNKQFEEVFKLPKPMIDTQSARIMSLQNPLSKMSKSDTNPLGMINLLDTPEEIANKIKRAVTDSGTEIVYRDDKPAMSNLLVIFSKMSGRKIPEIEQQYKGVGYSGFKSDLADAVIEALKPIQDKYNEIRNDDIYLEESLNEGRDFTLSKSSPKILQVKKAMGLGR